jgi:hypothetical protein
MSPAINPIDLSAMDRECWWSKGHGTLIEAPDGRWFIVYHAYENGFYTLGRQTLFEPIEWTADGWFKTAGFDAAKPIPKPAGAVPHGMPFSDDFSTDRMGILWSFYKGSKADRARYRLENGGLVLKAQGTSPADLRLLGEELLHAQLRPGSAAGEARRRRTAAAHPHPERSAHRDDAVQRGRADVTQVRPRDGVVRLPPQRGVRVPQPASRTLRRGHW